MLSPNAEKIIDQYFNLPFPGVDGVRCPYFNNSRKRSRGQLRALVGKGSPKEIVEEAKIISTQYHLGIFENDCSVCKQNLTADDLRKFMIDHDLGIECSGFVSQVLRAHFRETKNIDFTTKLRIYPPAKFFRYIISILRPIENISVRVLADDRNSSVVGLKDVVAGDIITMLETQPTKQRNHVLLIRNIEDNIIDYVHARAWSGDGKYGHGVTAGNIEIIYPKDGLLEQKWTENGQSDNKNETYLEAKRAKVLQIRRLKI
ncbi:MAG: hypothetical protein AAB467_02245 [Patescibacteria group bacterium]